MANGTSTSLFVIFPGTIHTSITKLALLLNRLHRQYNTWREVIRLFPDQILENYYTLFFLF
nr:MAG TPA: hypothetical protein [Bacteriophage sp.]